MICLKSMLATTKMRQVRKGPEEDLTFESATSRKGRLGRFKNKKNG